MFSISGMPAKQSVDDTITVLSGRLSSATLLEDRRATILGLRSFAKDFPASVASGALRSLIGSLGKDGEDVDTVKIVLETLLMLVSPNEESPEASDEISLWLADEFTQRQENITLLLECLDSSDFYSRLYSLQLLGAILLARTERTEECVLTAPLGISQLVAILDDQREAIRDEGIGLLISLTPTSTEIQKLVAFENAFEKIFAIIAADGSLAEGGRTVEDCLILLANLLRRNLSNQTLFRESGCITKLVDPLRGMLELRDEENNLAQWAHAQRNRNVYAFLAVIRLFLPVGSTATTQNQNAFWKHGLSSLILQLAFSHKLDIQIRAEALISCADMIRNNPNLQEGLAHLMVNPPQGKTIAIQGKHIGKPKTYAIDGLLDLTLNVRELSAFDLRFAACECLKAYFSNHSEVREHFLGRAIEGFQSGSEESANVLTVLLRFSDTEPSTDPYRDWFAAVITFHLLYESPVAKAKARGVTEGDSSKGEEVVSSIQTIAARLFTRLRRNDDPRILVGYLMLLIGWTFEDHEAVNDLLAEGSNIQSLIQVISAPIHSSGELVQGLCCMLLGFLYEFSTRDSPIPRATLQGILQTRLDRESYFDRLAKLRRHPILREFEVTSQKLSSFAKGDEVNVFFDAEFVDFFKDSYSRSTRAIDRSAEIEASIIANGIEKGISRDLVDSLKKLLRDKDMEIQEKIVASQSLQNFFEQEQMAHRRSKEEANVEMNRLKAAYETEQSTYTGELRKLENQQKVKLLEHERETAQLHQQLKSTEKRFQEQLMQSEKAAQGEAERAKLRAEAEIADLRASVSRLQVDLLKANKSKVQEMQALREGHEETIKQNNARLNEAEDMHRKLEKQLDDTNYEIEKLREEISKTRLELNEVNESRMATQSELDDLLMVYDDLEEKVVKYKTLLCELNQAVSDVEDGGGDIGSGVEDTGDEEEEGKDTK